MSNICEIRFKHDWNVRKVNGVVGGKLKNLTFTTIRTENPIYAVGNIFRVHNENDGKKAEVMGFARVQIVHAFKLGELKDWLAFLDTGYNAEETKKIIRLMYNNPPDSKPMVCVLFKYLTEKEVTEFSQKVIQALPLAT